MIDYDIEFRRLAARERVATLAADWPRAAPPPDPQPPQRSPSGRPANTLALLLARHHRHPHRVAAHRS